MYTSPGEIFSPTAAMPSLSSSLCLPLGPVCAGVGGTILSWVLFEYFLMVHPYFRSTMHRPNPLSNDARFMTMASSMS